MFLFLCCVGIQNTYGKLAAGEIKLNSDLFNLRNVKNILKLFVSLSSNRAAFLQQPNPQENSSEIFYRVTERTGKL